MIAQDKLENPWVGYQVKNEEGVFRISYFFKDQFGYRQDFHFSFPEEKVNKDVSKFGVPKSIFDVYVVTEKNLKYRKRLMDEGLFRLNGKIVEVDKPAFVNYYSDTYCKPIAEQIVEALAIYGKDNRRERIEMAMRFVQDIPYGVPEFANETTHFGGVSPPPGLLIEMKGDCDSKAFLFVGILSYLIDSGDIIFLNQPHHLLTAIRGEPQKGLTFVRYKRRKYLIAETAGPGERKLGQKGKYYTSKVNIEQLVGTNNEIIPYREKPLAKKYKK
ncbi:MAG: hypothetical protein GXO89_08995 [Chlorobi bacterium]|nr:hypothetical protein [Chlorobiota bacterium]